jgi:phage tail sheath protein FI
MATVYRTPGVYVEEIPKLPPSVAQVETAIPAFIGYTATAVKNGNSLFGKSLRITSLKEYETYFGQGPGAAYTAHLDTDNNVTRVESSQPYYLYESLKLFFDNGGGDCYILPVAPYESNGSVDAGKLVAALDVLEREDEPTIIVSPDAVLSSDPNGLYTFQQQALAQCSKLGDRFLLCDTKPTDEKVDGETLDDRVQQFRDNIGINNLKYGAAYVPYVNSALPKTIRFRDITLNQGDPGSKVGFESLTGDPTLLQLIADLNSAIAAVNALSALVKPNSTLVPSPHKSLEDRFKSLFNSVTAATSDSARATAVKAIYTYALQILASLDGDGFKNTLPNKVTATPVPASSTQSVAFVLRDDIAKIASTSGFLDAFKTLGRHSIAYGGGTASAALMPDDPKTSTTPLAKALNLLGVAATDYEHLTDVAAITALYTGASDAKKNEEGRKAIAAGYPMLLRFFAAIQAAASSYESTFDASLESGLGIYKQLKARIALSTSSLPPSAAVAGIYARVDNARGVWKAPANESINSVLGPVLQITADEQGRLNVDAVAGKSINVIRTFVGKGTLVWGARTLAGNDNEWRYVNVRRFFNMAEESSKKATEPFVFEANDANTWVKVQGMLENFLTILWRQGALQGAKPEHAFYVAVGLGKTMTALDILEGRMIVEIGMAVVRPAEFIILRFSHKLAES